MTPLKAACVAVSKSAAVMPARLTVAFTTFDVAVDAAGDAAGVVPLVVDDAGVDAGVDAGHSSEKSRVPSQIGMRKGLSGPAVQTTNGRVLHGQMPAFAQAKKADAGISTPQRLLRLSQPSILRPICKAATLPSKVTYKLTWKVAIEAPGTGIATVTGNESVLSASACSVLAIVTAAEVFICAFGLAHGSNSKVDTTLGAVEKTVSAKACVHTSLNPRVLSSQVQNVGFFVPKTSQNPVDVAEEAEARKARKARTKNGG